MKHRTDLLTSAHLGVLGKTGSGKTYMARGLVEELIRAGRRVCVIDPTGAWGGMKSSADGTAAGLPVVVLGGEDGYQDLPLTAGSGAAVAELVGSGQLAACVLNLSILSIGGQHRFVEHFLEELYRINRDVLHLVIDEADEFAPQSGAPGTERVLGATARIVQRGRLKGFRAILISQRPAVLNKRVLTQCNAIVAMRLPAPQDRKAIEEWIRGQADEEQATELLGSLSKLQRGEGWVWAPEHGILERSHFPKIQTFDSGRTPDGTGAVAAPKAFAELDLTKLQAALVESIKEAENNDPAKLRKRIAELEARPAAGPAVDVGQLEERYQLGMRAGARAARSAFSKQLFDVARSLSDADTPKWSDLAALEDLHGPPMVGGFLVDHGLLNGNGAKGTTRDTHQQAGTAAAEIPARPSPHHRAVSTPGGSAPGGGRGPSQAARASLKAPSLRILDAVAWWRSLGVLWPTINQVAFVAEMKPGTGHFNNSIGPLGSGDFIFRQDGCISLSEKGQAAARWPQKAGTLHDYHAGIWKLLEGRTADMFNAFVCAGNRPLTNEELGRAVAIGPGSGHFNNSIGPLSSLGLIKRSGGVNTPTTLMFPEGVR